ncbi:MAG TPA: hypothetical protein DDY14_09930 [Chromatiaceae bacterium]|nr:MAG: hypothetical protein N838_10390 [Thiohalocapsa sp. PB-PSB1]QQO53731.1 MAG: hypothetical protein N838_10590 [Thiohalocapsa sp. PB-PSB1]HBG95617.1 hypothetical protein [Chromatiaceae bacterium]HCS88495.1 hypothetical protein [Chromatiaceae bacterium]
MDKDEPRQAFPHPCVHHAIVLLVCTLIWHLSRNDQMRRLFVVCVIADLSEQAEQTGLLLIGPV